MYAGRSLMRKQRRSRIKLGEGRPYLPSIAHFIIISESTMVLRWLTLGVAIGAFLYTYRNPSQVPLSTSEASLKLREFWYRTFFMQQSAPYLTEQSHIAEHPSSKNALSPVQAQNALHNEPPITAAAIYRMPVYFISHGLPSAMYEPDSLPYKAWQSVGQEILDWNPKAILVASSGWEGANGGIQVNTGSENPLICKNVLAKRGDYIH